MRQPVTIHPDSRRNVKNVSYKATVILLFLCLALAACQKDPLLTRELKAGTMCNIYPGVFLPGDKQPATPVTVVSLYRGANYGLMYYTVLDSKGETWQIPDNDLQVLK